MLRHLCFVHQFFVKPEHKNSSQKYDAIHVSEYASAKMVQLQQYYH